MFFSGGVPNFHFRNKEVKIVKFFVRLTSRRPIHKCVAGKPQSKYVFFIFFSNRIFSATLIFSLFKSDWCGRFKTEVFCSPFIRLFCRFFAAFGSSSQFFLLFRRSPIFLLFEILTGDEAFSLFGIRLVLSFYRGR